MTLSELIAYLEDYRAKHPGHASLEVAVDSDLGLPAILQPTLRLAEPVPDCLALVFAEE